MRIQHIALLAAAMTSFCGCSTVALTGRKQLMLVNDEQVLSLSNESYKEYMATATASTDKANTAMVTKIGKRLASAVESYLTANGLSSEIENFAWEFNLVQSDEANAFCMPGGKIVVYEGILPYTKNENGLAIVLGHEIAHAVAKHSAERMSQQMVAQYGSQALSILMSGKSEGMQSIAQTVFGLGANYGVMLPFSRKDETEADQMGLVFAAMAGYDPNEAVTFWERMSTAGSSTPEFLSDHPSNENRIKNIKETLPTALKYYKAAKSK